MGEPVVELEGESELPRAHRREFQMETKEYISYSIKRECNVLSHF